MKDQSIGKPVILCLCKQSYCPWWCLGDTYLGLNFGLW